MNFYISQAYGKSGHGSACPHSPWGLEAVKEFVQPASVPPASEVSTKFAYHFSDSASVSVHGRDTSRLCKDGDYKEINDSEKRPRNYVTYFRV